jgi:hypothetical protein
MTPPIAIQTPSYFRSSTRLPFQLLNNIPMVQQAQAGSRRKGV